MKRAAGFQAVLALVAVLACGAEEGSAQDGGRDSGTPTVGFVSLSAATYTMGSPASDPCRSTDPSEDQHEVTLTHRFEIAITEVTQGEFEKLMGYNPSSQSSCGASCPVETVSWHEAAAYCNALSTEKGLAACYTCSGSGAAVLCQEAASYDGTHVYLCPGFRLPTEAEWEYAYRSGTTTAYYNGSNDPAKCVSCSDANADAIGWYSCNASGATHAVKQKSANAWGLYDMAGNVAEWCHDWFQDSLGLSAVKDPVGSGSSRGSSGRVVRGGSVNSDAFLLRATHRSVGNPADRTGGLGLRCCRSTSE